MRVRRGRNDIVASLFELAPEKDARMAVGAHDASFCLLGSRGVPHGVQVAELTDRRDDILNENVARFQCRLHGVCIGCFGLPPAGHPLRCIVVDAHEHIGLK